jgi:3-methyladenine DNA glycosylase AlkD
MKKPEDLVKEIRKYCRENADAEKAKKYERYFKEGYDSWGIIEREHPFYNAKQSGWLEKYADLGVSGFVKAGALLFESGKYEEGAMAIRFIKSHLDEMDAKAVASLGAWFASGIGNWAHTDVLCGEVLKPLLLSGQIRPLALEPWRKSEYKYQRRAAAVALIGLLKKAADIAKLIEFVRPLMHDKERVVHQGVGWFLREAWKIDPKPVEAFLAEFKDTAPRLIFQYATEKMTAAQKTRYKKSK